MKKKNKQEEDKKGTQREENTRIAFERAEERRKAQLENNFLMLQRLQDEGKMIDEEVYRKIIWDTIKTVEFEHRVEVGLAGPLVEKYGVRSLSQATFDAITARSHAVEATKKKVEIRKRNRKKWNRSGNRS